MLGLHKGDEWKAAFLTNHELFESLVMFFQMTNSPATFQTTMNEIFMDMICDNLVCIYMVHILMFAQSKEDLRRMTRALKKPEFKKKSVKYLCLIVWNDKVRMDPAKLLQ